MNITSAGIGSGLDLESIIEVYVSSEAIPTEIRLQNKEDRLTAELSGVGKFKSALSNFETALKKLSDVDDFNQQTVLSSNDSISVTTNGFASNGNFSIKIEQLAQGSRVQSTVFGSSSDTVGAGTLTFNAGSETFDVDIDASDSLSVIRDKVNEQAENFGVTANIINVGSGSYLVYNSEITGDTNNLSVTSTGTLDAISTLATQGAEDVAKSAIAYVDDNMITQSTNEFKNIIEDVTFTAISVNIDDVAELSISQDDENGKKLIDNFISGYNTLIDAMDSLSDPETGELAFDPAIRSMKSQLSKIVNSSISGVSGSITSLDDIGISTNKFGKLEIGTTTYGTLSTGTEKLTSALENKLNEVGELFASDDGVTTQLNALLDSYIGSDGSITTRNSSLSLEVSGIKDEYQDLEDRLRNYEDMLRRKFTFLDQTVSTFNNTSVWLTSTLSGLSGNNKD